MASSNCKCNSIGGMLGTGHEHWNEPQADTRFSERTCSSPDPFFRVETQDAEPVAKAIFRTLKKK